MEKTLLLHDHPPGTLVKLDRYLHKRADGMIGALSHAIRGAAIDAILSGTERVTKAGLDTTPWTMPRKRRRWAAEVSRPLPELPRPPAPLPVRLRPCVGAITDSYVRRLARANHLKPSYLHCFLS